MPAPNMTPLAPSMLAVVVSGALAGANGADAADVGARALAAGCRSCHQPGEATIPSLDGKSREALAGKLRAYREGSLAGTVMPQLAKGYTDVELDAIARYFELPSGRENECLTTRSAAQLPRMSVNAIRRRLLRAAAALPAFGVAGFVWTGGRGTRAGSSSSTEVSAARRRAARGSGGDAIDVTLVERDGIRVVPVVEPGSRGRRSPRAIPYHRWPGSASRSSTTMRWPSTPAAGASSSPAAPTRLPPVGPVPRHRLLLRPHRRPARRRTAHVAARLASRSANDSPAPPARGHAHGAYSRSRSRERRTVSAGGRTSAPARQPAIFSAGSHAARC